MVLVLMTLLGHMEQAHMALLLPSQNLDMHKEFMTRELMVKEPMAKEDMAKEHMVKEHMARQLMVKELMVQMPMVVQQRSPLTRMPSQGSRRQEIGSLPSRKLTRSSPP